MTDDLDTIRRRAYLTLTEAARALEVSTTILRKWIDCGQVRVVYIGPPGSGRGKQGLRRIERAEVDRLVRKSA